MFDRVWHILSESLFHLLTSITFAVKFCPKIGYDYIGISHLLL